MRPIHGVLGELAYESFAALQLDFHLLHLVLLLVSVGTFSGFCSILHPLDQLYRRRNPDIEPLLWLQTWSGAIVRRSAWVWYTFPAIEDFLDNFPSPPAFVDAPGNFIHAGLGLDKVRLIGVVIRGTVYDSGEEQRVFHQPLDGLDEKRREIPCVGEGRSESSGMIEIGGEGGRFLEAVEVFEGGRVPCDVLLIRWLQ